MLAIWFWGFVIYMLYCVWLVQYNSKLQNKIELRRAKGLSNTRPLIFFWLLITINCVVWPITIWFALYKTIKRRLFSSSG